MIRLLLLCVLLTACAPLPAPPPEVQNVATFRATVKEGYGQQEIRVVHDVDRAVTCWVMQGGYNSRSPAISCLPDAQIGKTR
ncbi:hypothetical protein [Pseudoxanthomonas sp.]|uniref:hypothetical protein n=1 Tax=Pseudoxanthomonas sp. TaxID=1871049 RepID=UPI0025FC6850|nr:hypothetical protein [Pseudoxanthomonas sp.]